MQVIIRAQWLLIVTRVRDVMSVRDVVSAKCVFFQTPNKRV